MVILGSFRLDRAVRGPVMLVVSTTVLALFTFVLADDARASCNLIPLALRQFGSSNGGLTSPITAPGQTVEIVVGSCDSSSGFEPVASDNLVTLTFQPPGVGADTPVPITVLDDNLEVDDCTLPGGRCKTLRFTTPSTTAELPPYGLAGPAEILVTDPGLAELARIDSLYAPTSGCDDWPERVFEQFTVLPDPNLVADLVAGVPPAMLATVDGGGNLLVPLDHWGGGGGNSVLASTPGAPDAILLGGSADIPAQGAGDVNTILQVLSAQPNPERFARSFTLDGRPLPPLLRLTATGQVFGTSDAVSSVLRFQRNDGDGGPDLFDLSDRLFMDRGPILIGTYSVDRRDPLPLVSLRSAEGAVGYVRSEVNEGEFLNPDGDQLDYVAQVVDVATGSSTPTAKAVTLVGEGSIRTPAVLAGGDLFAFLESESGQGVNYNADTDFDDSILRVYRSDGTELTSGIDIEADTAPLLDRRTLAISGDRVFFRTPASAVQTVVDGVAGADGLDGAFGAIVSPDGLHVYVASIVDDAVAVYSRDPVTGALTFVDVEPVPGGDDVHSLVISPDGDFLYVRSWPPASALTVYSRNALSGLLTFVEQEVDGVGGVDGLFGYGFVQVSPDGAHVYVVSGESTFPGDDLVSIFSRNPFTGEVTFIEDEPVVQGENLSFSPDGSSVYINTELAEVLVYARDTVTGLLSFVQSVPVDNPRVTAVSADGAYVYVGGGLLGTFDNLSLYARDGVTGALTYLEGAELPGNAPLDSISGVVYGRILLSPGGGRMYLNADGPIGLERDAVSGSFEAIENLPGKTFSDSFGTPALSPDGRHLYWPDWTDDRLVVHRVDSGLAVFDAETQNLRSVGLPATRVAVAGERALFLQPEEVSGLSANGDFDIADSSAMLLDATGVADVVTPLGVSARRVALSDDVIVLVVGEGSHGSVDRNDDGDEVDTVLAVADVSNPADVRFVGMAADAIAVTGTTVVFARPEWMEKKNAPGCKPTNPAGGCDLNGNGNADDRVVQVYRHEFGGIGTVENVGWQVSAGEESGFGFDNDRFPERPETVAKGTLVAFFTDEPATAGLDLNKDLDTTDLGIVQFLDLSKPGSAPINSGIPGLPCNFASCEPALPFRVDPARKAVSFVAWEALVGADLDGNGSALDFVLNVYNLNTGEPQRIPLFEFSENSSLARLPEDFLDGQIVYSWLRESEVGVDLNGDGLINFASAVALAGDADDDGMFDDFDSCVEESNANDIDGDGDALGDTACDPNPRPCPPTPEVGCKQITQPAKGKLAIREAADDSKDSLQWVWNKGDVTELADFGDPIDGFAHYSFCVYDTSVNAQPVMGATLKPGILCGGAPCWSKAGKKGFKLQDKAGSQDGVTQVKLGAGEAGKAKARVKGRGASLEMPTLPLATPVLAQVVVRDGDRVACWEAGFSTFDQNDSEGFKAKSD
jgi:6-phosphogluconolactonase (cycloisomerase 2 family)